MVVRMSMGKSIRDALSYNEKKVATGDAELILASNFSRDITEMGFSEKLLRFEKMNRLNGKTKTNTLHLSLNFSPGESLDHEKLQKIATDYMEHIGFADQPFLVYRHLDTKHPHIHIVTNTIKKNGKAIYLHNLAKRKSEPARKAIEQEYNLVVAEQQKNGLQEPFTISRQVSDIFKTYKFRSLEELNAILAQHHIQAFQTHNLPNGKIGLIYRKVDDIGNKVGVPVRASNIYGFPTITELQKRFNKNATLLDINKDLFRQQFNEIIKKIGNDALPASLRKRGITIYKQVNPVTNEPSVFIIDNYRKLIYNSKDLGIEIPSALLLPAPLFDKNVKPESINEDQSLNVITGINIKLLKTLLVADQYSDGDINNNDLTKKRKKKRKKK